MTRTRGLLAGCGLALAVLTVARADDEPSKMKTYQMVLLRRPATASAAATDVKQLEAQRTAHAARLEKLHEERVCLIEGEFLDAQELRGLAVLDVPDADAARARFADDPLVTSGALVVEVRPWLGPVGFFHEAKQPRESERLVFGFLTRGPNRSQSKEESAKLQEGHLAYMGDLHKQGKLVMAGPFMDDSEIRGVVVYRVPGVADAEALAAGDPSVKAGRLVIVARPWATWKGILE